MSTYGLHLCPGCRRLARFLCQFAAKDLNFALTPLQCGHDWEQGGYQGFAQQLGQIIPVYRHAG
ncbi:hypothetical protein ACI3L1_17565 [Deinococcus sp. SM5_A1]|uniref:hypothetical protein n=1 Tax=Deinococcus sp. SM5_A1 TaxID=3379094 RepID=UPI00385A5D73